MSCQLESHDKSWVWLPGFLGVLLVHLVWQLLNDAPPAWDMAFHQLKGWQMLELGQQGGPLSGIWSTSFPYPPLYHWIEGVILWIVGDTRLIAFLANLPGILMLSYFTYRVGLYSLSPLQASWAGILSLLFPMVAWISRESLLDVPLAGFVAATGFLVLRSQFFTKRSWVLLLGLVCAGGMLTKWTFPVYVCALFFYGFWKSPQRQRALSNLIIAGLLAFPLVLVYYGPNFLALASSYPTTEQTSWVPWQPYPRHGEPGLNNLWGWIYYPRVLASYFLFLPLTLLFLIGLIRFRTEDTGRDLRSTSYLWCWLIAGILLLTFVTPKDPRFAIPLVTPLAVLLVYSWRRSSLFLSVIVTVAMVQFLLVSFAVPFSPSKVAFFDRSGDLDFQNIQREWVIFQSQYFGITGPPRQEEWFLSEILDSVPDGATLGVLPELPRLNVNSFHLQAARTGKEVHALALGNRDDWQQRLYDLDFVLGKTGHQGLSFITRFNREIMDSVLLDEWTLVREWTLPDDSVALLMRNPQS
jgi:4-amino-4-deoxy-L-arabinose transferase-like glycosyltransferase